MLKPSASRQLAPELSAFTLWLAFLALAVCFSPNSAAAQLDQLSLPGSDSPPQQPADQTQDSEEEPTDVNPSPGDSSAAVPDHPRKLPTVNRVLIENGVLGASSYSLFAAFDADATEDSLDQLVNDLARRIAEANREQADAPGEPNLASATYWLSDDGQSTQLQLPIVLRNKENVANLIATGDLRVLSVSPDWTASWKDHAPASEAAAATEEMKASMLAQSVAGGGPEELQGDSFGPFSALPTLNKSPTPVRLEWIQLKSSVQNSSFNFQFSRPTALWKLQYEVDLSAGKEALRANATVYNRMGIDWRCTRVLLASPDRKLIYDLGKIDLASQRGGTFPVKDIYPSKQIQSKSSPAPPEPLVLSLARQPQAYLDRTINSSPVTWATFASPAIDLSLLNVNFPTRLYDQRLPILELEKLPVFAGVGDSDILNASEYGIALEPHVGWKAKISEKNALRRVKQLRAEELTIRAGTTYQYQVTLDKKLSNTGQILIRHRKGKNEKLLYQFGDEDPTSANELLLWDIGDDDENKIQFLVRNESTKVDKINVFTAASKEFSGIRAGDLTTCDPNNTLAKFIEGAKALRKQIEDATKTLATLKPRELALAQLEDKYVVDHWKHAANLQQVRTRRAEVKADIQRLESSIQTAQFGLELLILKSSCFSDSQAPPQPLPASSAEVVPSVLN